jgi:formylmethanofuran dehydrogenase subunit E
MNLSNAKLGDQFRIFLDESGNISLLPNMNTMLATIIAVKKATAGSTDVLLGWKKNEPHPQSAQDRGNTSPDNDYLTNQSEYRYGKTVKRTLPVAVQIFNGLDGFPCKKCTNFFPLSAPNQKDGTLICWSCRNGK